MVQDGVVSVIHQVDISDFGQQFEHLWMFVVVTRDTKQCRVTLEFVLDVRVTTGRHQESDQLTVDRSTTDSCV